MKTQALLIADDATYAGWLQTAAGAGLDVRPLAAREPEQVLASVAAERRVDLLFCEFDARNLASRARLVEDLLERFPQLPIVGLGAGDDAELVLAAMRAGARDFFVLRRDDATLDAQIGRVLRRSGATAAANVPAQKPGRIYALLAAHPQEAIAFVAEHLALAINQSVSSPDRVLLLDLATPAGAAAVFLNLTQTYSVLDAIGDAYRCDQTLVDTAFTRHASGVYVLSLPEDLQGRPVLDGDELLRLLRVLSGLFAQIVVTLDGHLPLPILAGVAAQADRLLLLSDQSILKSRHNKYLLRALRKAGCELDRAGLVVDNYRRRLGLEPRNLAELFDLPLVIALQSESHNRIVSMNSGEPMFAQAPKEPFWLGVKQLAQMLMAGQAEARPVAQSLVKRLLSSAGMGER